MNDNLNNINDNENDSLEREEMENEYQGGTLIFPSYIETVGLPLLEARSCNTMVLASDTPFAHECLAGYHKARFFPPFEAYELAEKILEHGGCLISEYDQGITPQKNYFIDRDRIQSGLSNGIIIVESDETGGTMHTANFAQKQYRRIACYYSNLLEHMSGNKYLVESGKGEMLEKMEDVQVFMNRILNDEEYEQMTFDFSWLLLIINIIDHIISKCILKKD